MRQHLQHTVAVGLSSIHGRGLFSLRPVLQHQMLIEYTGELIRFRFPPAPQMSLPRALILALVRPPLADIREKYYMQVERLDSFYFFRVDDCWIVDATKVPVACCLLAGYLAAVLCYLVCLVMTCAETQPGALH
jgi:hypothetical protein